MLTASITVSTKKGHTQETVWSLRQDRPFPDIEARGGGCMNWRNAGGVLPQFGRPAEGLPPKYTAALLRSDLAAAGERGNRLDHAGHVGYGATDRTPAPGTIVYRGTDLGETTAEIDVRPHGYGVLYRVRGGDRPTPGEDVFLAAQVTPGLLAAVQRLRDKLYAEAVAAVRDQFARQLAEARESLAKLEAEAERAIAALQAQK